MAEVSTAQDLSVLIPHYGSYELLRTCLNSLLPTNPAQLVVVEDGCHDPSILGEYPSVEFVRLRSNRGFPTACNRGLEHVETPYVAILNNDVTVTPQWHNPLLATLKGDSTIAACQPKILSARNPRRFDYAGAAGGFLDRYGYPFCRGRIFDAMEVDVGQYDTPSDIFWASGTALVARTGDIHEVGGFDARLFAYMEEIDLCWRLQALGKRIVYVPESTVYHQGSATWSSMPKKKTYLLHRNNLLVLIKNSADEDLSSIALVRIMMELASAAHFLARGEPRVAESIVRALSWNLTHFPELRAKRLEESRKGIRRKRRGAMRGVYPGSIAFQHFLRGISRFSELQWP